MPMTYKLLTPGPLTTTDTVKREMLFDHCTWDDDYKRITQRIRRRLLALAHAPEATHTAILLQGSGTFGVEATLTSIPGPDDKLLILANGAYGDRMADIARHAALPHTHLRLPLDASPDPDRLRQALADDPAITHVALVHSETTTGILNDLPTLAPIVKAAGKTLIVDAMSSFAGVDLDWPALGVDFLVSSANKCVQGVPGFSFVIADRAKLIASQGHARSLSLDLHDQWATMEQDGKWRFTSPTHAVLAFAKALDELDAEGGVPARAARYRANNRLLIAKLAALGFRPYLPPALQGPIITTFLYPEGHAFAFQDLYAYVKARGYAIYPGKLTDADTFRLGNIGEIYEGDILNLAAILRDFLAEHPSK